MVWSRELAAAEIADLYRNGLVPSANLAGRWLMDKGAGATVNDISGNGNNGTITSVVWNSDSPGKARQPYGGNLVLNGDFSYIPPFVAVTTTTNRWVDGTAGGSTNSELKKLFGWYFTKDGTASAQFDRSTKYNGKNSFKISTLAAASFIECRYRATGYTTSVVEGFALNPNTVYRMTFAMKTTVVSGDSADGAKLVLFEANGAGANIKETSLAYVKATRDWTLYTLNITTQATTRSGHFEARIYGHTGAGTLIMDAWFTDIQLIKVEAARAAVTGRVAA